MTRLLILASTLLLAAPAMAQTAPVDEPLELAEPALEVDRVGDPHVVERVFVELGMGLLAGTFGGMVGGFAGAGIGAASANEPFWSSAGLGGGLVGHAVVALGIMPLAVAGSATWLDGRGDVWAAYVGELVGGGAAAGLIALALAAPDPALGTLAGFGAILLPLFGAIAGYEISDDVNRAAGARQDGNDTVAWMPTVSPTADGQGMTAGIVGSF